MRIAIIGTGIGGLAAAWYLGREHQLTLYEKLPRLGMSAHGIEVGSEQARLRIDVPLRVLYKGYYPTLMRLYAEAGVDTVPVDYSASFGAMNGENYFQYKNWMVAGRSIPYLGHPDQLRPDARAIGLDLLRLYRFAAKQLKRGELENLRLDEFLERENYSTAFIEKFILPAFAGIATCDYDSVRAYPAEVIVNYLTQGVLFEGVRRTVHPADFAVKRLASRIQEKRLSAQVERIELLADGVRVHQAGKAPEDYDHLIMATQANQIANLIPQLPGEESRIFDGFGYEHSRVLVHTDPKLCPRKKRHWSPVNFLLKEGADRPMATIWLNKVLPLPEGEADVFQSWNPLREPEEKHLLSCAEFQRPVINQSSQKSWQGIQELHQQADRRLWYCGSYARPGVPLLEGAAASALAVSEAINARV